MARMPRKVQPMLCTLVDEPPGGSGWTYETKWDGERVLAFVERVRGRTTVTLQTRILRDTTPLYPEIVEDLVRIRAKSAVIDGEIVALDRKGRVSFEALQRRFGLTDDAEIAKRMAATPASYVAFDLLWLDGKDLRARPLKERRALLSVLFRRCRRTAYSKGFIDAAALLRAVKKVGSEGIVAKRSDSPYREGVRGKEWLKIKVTESQEFVVGGWTEGKGGRAGGFGALVIGVYEKRGGRRVLVPVGSVGTGFDQGTMRQLMRALRPLKAAACPFVEEPEVNDVPHWVRPKLVVQVKFANWTGDGQLRAPVYLGLRDDKRPQDCVRERPKKAR